MPVVPVIQRTVEQAPLGAVSLPSAPEPQAPTAAMQLLANERKKANQIAVLDADNQMAEFQTTLQTDLLSRQGKQAFGNVNEAKTRWAKFRDSIMAKITDPSQQASIGARFDERWAQLNSTLQHDLIGKRLDFDNQTTTTALAYSNARVQQNYNNPAIVAQALDEQAANIKDAFSRHGELNKHLVIDEVLAQNRSDTYQTVIEQMMLNGQGQQAKAYFNALPAGSLTVDAHLKLQQQVEKSSVNNQADELVSSVLPALLPKDPTRPMYESDVMAAIKQQTPDAAVWKAAEPLVGQFVKDFNLKGKQLLGDRQDAIFHAAAIGTPLQDIHQMPEYIHLRGQEQENFDEQIRRAQSKTDEDVKTAQAMRWGELFSDPKLLNDTNLNAELVSKSISGTQFTALTTIKEKQDPTKTKEGAIAIDTIKRMGRQHQFDDNVKTNETLMAEHLNLLNTYIQNHWTQPDYNPQEYVDKLLVPAKDGWLRRVLDTLPGVDAYETPDARRLRLQQEAGVPPSKPITTPQLEVGKTYTNAQGVQAVYLGNGKWQLKK